MSLAHDYRREAIERRQRMKMAGLQRVAAERRAIQPPKVEYVPLVVVNETPDELRRARVIERKHPTIGEVTELVAEYFGLTERHLLSERRTKDVLTPRHVLYWLCKQTTPHSYPQIGRFLCGRDHTTILHGCRRIEQRIAAGEPVADDCHYLLGELTGIRPSPYYGA